jgi:hypothetical protein
MTTYTILNLQNDSISLVKNLKDALTGPEEGKNAAWLNAAVSSTKIVAGLRTDLSGNAMSPNQSIRQLD